MTAEIVRLDTAEDARRPVPSPEVVAASNARRGRERLRRLIRANHFRDPMLTETMRLIEASGLDFNDITDRAGVSRSAVQNIVAGHKPLLVTVQSILGALGYRLRIEKMGEG